VISTVAINKDYVGRTFPATAPYEVSRVKIAEFADAIGDANPLYRDRGAAQAAGYPDVIAPPTFPIVVAMAASGAAVGDPGLGLNYAMVVHGEQRFEYSRPLHAGDVVTAQSTISGIREAGSITMLTTQTEIRTLTGEHVCTGFSTLVERGEA
jgi:acyl dehydratase